MLCRNDDISVGSWACRVISAPTDTGSNVALILAHRIRRLPGFKPTLDQRVVFSGVSLNSPDNGFCSCSGGNFRGHVQKVKSHGSQREQAADRNDFSD